jgi:simple sugar transport system permease protein
MDWGRVIGPSALPGLINSGIRFAVPIALAGIGETLCERAGVLNLGLEGMMLSGALGGFMAAFYSGNMWVGLLVGILAGVLLGSVMAFLSVTLKSDQVINGIAIVLFAQGFTSFVYGRAFSTRSSPPQIRAPHPLHIPGLSSIPLVGQILFRHTLLVYVAVGLVAVVWWVLFRTRLGLTIRAVGEDPAAADAAAINVARFRWGAVVACGALAGFGGAVLVIDQLQQFQPNITSGEGWIAIALVIFGRWNPVWVALGGLLFGLTEALQLSIQAAQGGLNAGVPYELFAALPYLVTIAAIVVSGKQGRRSAKPSALGIPFRKEVSR